jgi:hypothetical protein
MLMESTALLLRLVRLPKFTTRAGGLGIENNTTPASHHGDTEARRKCIWELLRRDGMLREYLKKSLE